MSASRQRSNKRSREQSANVSRDNTNEATEVEFRFLKAPNRGVQQARQLLLFDEHIKKEFGDISCLVRGKDPKEILDPVPVGTPIPQEVLATPAATGSLNRSRANQQQVLMSRTRHDKEASKAVDAREERKNDISKALGVILETVDGSFRKYRQRTPAAEEAYNANDIKTIMTHLEIWYRETLGSIGFL